MKVKNLMFFGVAAAILSIASANAAQQGYTFVGTSGNEGSNAGGYSDTKTVAAKSYVDKKADQLKVDINAISNTADGAVVANEDITPGTHTKITYDAKGLVTAGADITLSDVTDVTATATEVNYLSGVTSGVQSQIDSKLPTSTYNSQIGTVSAQNMGTTASTVVGAINEIAGTAGSALQSGDITTGTTPNSISVDGTDVAVSGYAVDSSCTAAMQSGNPCALVEEGNGTKKWYAMAI